jgi:hypothetical protein
MRNRILFGLILVAFMAVPLRAYRLALKDGKTVQFEKYRATETVLFYTGGDGKEIAIPLTDVDLDRTQQLNVQEPVPLDLPGLVPAGGTNGTEPSLGELARQQRKNKSGAGAKRVLTDDDVAHSSPALPTAQTAPTENTQIPTESVQRITDITDSFANKTATQMANEVVGDAQFPGRDVWEQKLYGQEQKLLKFAQGYLDQVKKLETITDPAERSAAFETAKNFEREVKVEGSVYTQMAADGAQKANEWAERPR